MLISNKNVCSLLVIVYSKTWLKRVYETQFLVLNLFLHFQKVISQKKCFNICRHFYLKFVHKRLLELQQIYEN